MQQVIRECAPHLAVASLHQRHKNPGHAVGRNNEWFTPPNVIAVARQAMGAIDLDPASCAEANAVVRADTYYTKEENGWTHEWYGRVWLNPPFSGFVPGNGGKPINNKRAFIDKLVWHYTRGEVEQACLITTTDFSSRWGQGIRDHATALCFSTGRWGYWTVDRDETCPGHGSLMTYFGNYPERFRDACHEHGIGFVVYPEKFDQQGGE